MKRKKIIIGTSAVLVWVIAILLGGSAYLLRYSLCPEDRGKDLNGSWKHLYHTYPHVVSWADSLRNTGALKDTFIYATDGVKLHALYASAAKPTSQTAVIIHGYTDNAVNMMMIGYLYNRELGFNILLPNLRYTGLSDGKTTQMGWQDRKDVLQWMEVAQGIYGDSIRMVVHGISMGAACTMMLSGETLPRYVKCFIEDCGYTSVWDQFTKELKAQFGLPAFPLMYIASWLCDLKYGWNFKEASSLNQVARCPLPMLFIHGDKDDYVPTWMVYRLYEAKPAPKELWIAEGADHAHSYLYHTKEYTEKVKAFVDQYMK